MIIFCPNNNSKCEVDIPKHSKNIRTYSLIPKGFGVKTEIDEDLLNQIRKEVGDFTNFVDVICIFCGHNFLVLYNNKRREKKKKNPHYV